jgi:hypothetical protein
VVKFQTEARLLFVILGVQVFKRGRRGFRGETVETILQPEVNGKASRPFAGQGLEAARVGATFGCMSAMAH